MKKYISGFILGVLTTVGITVFAEEVKSFIAEKATFDVYVAGEKFESDKPAVVIDGSTYLPLRATGEALGVPVEWNAEKRRVEVGDVKENQEAIVSPVPTSTPVPTNIPVHATTPETSKGTVKKSYYYKSNILPEVVGKFPMLTLGGENYLLPGTFGMSNIVYGDNGTISIQLPGKEPVPVTNNNSIKHEGQTFVKLSSLSLKARIEGDTAYIEWAD